MNLAIVSLETLFQAFAEHNKYFHVDISAMQCTNNLSGIRRENGFMFQECLIDFLETWWIFSLNEPLRKKKKKESQFKFHNLGTTRAFPTAAFLAADWSLS